MALDLGLRVWDPVKNMKVLVVGSGGREHALCWKIAKSKMVDEVLCAPGNAGTALVARNVAVQATDVERILAVVRRENGGLVVIGPETSLDVGLADTLREAKVPVFGPGIKGARLESSKVYSKDLMERHRIPTASSRTFDRSGAAKGYLENCDTWPQVVKADGLAAGKGVYVCQDLEEGRAAVDAIMEEKRHGSSGTRILVEEFMEGQEASVFAIIDGRTILILETVQDHKQVGEGNKGPNTGGMGVLSPMGEINTRLHRQIEQRVLIPTVHAMRQEGIDFHGVLFVGLMMTEGGPRVVEYNVRFGDPETQALVRRWKSDIVPVLLACAKGELEKVSAPEWDGRPCVGVVAAAGGYPDEYRKGDVISGLRQAEEVDDVVVFHAGTEEEDGEIVTAGGRVLCITAMGADVDTARSNAYEAYDKIRWEDKFARRDIGKVVLEETPKASAQVDEA